MTLPEDDMLLADERWHERMPGDILARLVLWAEATSCVLPEVALQCKLAARMLREVMRRQRLTAWLCELDNASGPAQVEGDHAAALNEMLAQSPTQPPQAGPAEPEIRRIMSELTEMLVAKNRAYGNSALDPVRIFSKATPQEQILVRLDDKLSRLARGSEFPGDDTIRDLVGYLVLLLVSKASEQSAEGL